MARPERRFRVLVTLAPRGIGGSQTDWLWCYVLGPCASCLGFECPKAHSVCPKLANLFAGARRSLEGVSSPVDLKAFEPCGHDRGL